MSGEPWSDDRLDELTRLRVTEGRDWPEVARLMGKTIPACKARLAVSEGRRTSNGAMPGARPVERPYEAPPFRANDDALHLRLILESLRAGRAA